MAGELLFPMGDSLGGLVVRMFRALGLMLSAILVHSCAPASSSSSSVDGPLPIPPAQWEASTSIGGFPVDPGVSEIQVKMDSQGNGLAVWRVLNDDAVPDTSELWFNRYLAGVGWLGPQPLVTQFWAYLSSMAMDSQGNAIIGLMDGASDTMAMRFDVQTGWGAPQYLEGSVNWTGGPQVAMDESGNGMAVWTETYGTIGEESGRVHIWSARYQAGVGWQLPELVEPFDSVSDFPHLSMNASGEAMVVWFDYVFPNTPNVWAARNDGSGWEEPVLIESLGGPAAFIDDQGSHVGMDAAGNAIAVWLEIDAEWNNWFETPISIWSNRYVKGQGWGEPELILDSGPVRYLELGVGAGGEAVVSWCQWDSFPVAAPTMRARRWDGLWSPVHEFSAGAMSEVALDNEGNALLVWTNFWVPDPVVMAATYRIEDGWSAGQSVAGPGNLGIPALALSSIDSATLVWREWDAGVWTLWSRSWKRPD